MIACQAPLSMEFSSQEYWRGLSFPPPGGLSDPGIEPGFPALQADYLLSEPLGSPNPGLMGTILSLWQSSCKCKEAGVAVEAPVRAPGPFCCVALPPEGVALISRGQESKPLQPCSRLWEGGQVRKGRACFLPKELNRGVAEITHPHPVLWI